MIYNYLKKRKGKIEWKQIEKINGFTFIRKKVRRSFKNEI